jgi:Fic family protein
MNDTNLSTRQSAILSNLYDRPQKGAELLEKLRSTYPISKATLIRDISKLIVSGLVAAHGRGKATTYSASVNPVLKPLSLDEYFKENSALRKTGAIPFNNEIFSKLDNLYSKNEIDSLTQKHVSLNSKRETLDPSIFKKELERFTVEFAWKSSKIEGNTYSLLETEVLIKQMREAIGKTKYEAIMILNHKDAVDYILIDPESFKKLRVEKVMKLHEILTKDLEVTREIRNNPVAITGTDFMPLKNKRDIENSLEKSIKVINDAEFPLAKALLTIALISYVQPFVDGNKRTSRALSNAILIAHDYFPFSYRNLDEVEYLKAVLLFYETNNLYHLKRIFTNQYTYSLENYFQ